MVSCFHNKQLCLESITDWINTMSVDGWIPGEQTRGEELRSYKSWHKADKRQTTPPIMLWNIEQLINTKDF